MDLLIGTMLMFGLPVYLALQLWTAIRWTGGWRTAALAPLLLMVPVALHAAVALMAQSNLWPLLVILTSPIAALYLLALAGLRRSAS
jgi:hypothetical protein